MGNEYHQGEDKYPKTLTYAYKPLVNWNQNTRNVLQFFNESVTNGKVDFSNIGDHKSDEGLYLTKPGRKHIITCTSGVSKGALLQ